MTHDELREKAATMLAACHAYWDAYQEFVGKMSAVVWVRDERGRLAIFTRGEYEGDLLRNIERNHEASYMFGHASDEAPPEEPRR